MVEIRLNAVDEDWTIRVELAKLKRRQREIQEQIATLEDQVERQQRGREISQALSNLMVAVMEDEDVSLEQVLKQRDLLHSRESRVIQLFGKALRENRPLMSICAAGTTMNTTTY